MKKNIEDIKSKVLNKCTKKTQERNDVKQASILAGILIILGVLYIFYSFRETDVERLVKEEMYKDKEKIIKIKQPLENKIIKALESKSKEEVNKYKSQLKELEEKMYIEYEIKVREKYNILELHDDDEDEEKPSVTSEKEIEKEEQDKISPKIGKK